MGLLIASGEDCRLQRIGIGRALIEVVVQRRLVLARAAERDKLRNLSPRRLCVQCEVGHECEYPRRMVRSVGDVREPAHEA